MSLKIIKSNKTRKEKNNSIKSIMDINLDKEISLTLYFLKNI